jgi:lactoylglutathione lyase
MATLGIVGTAHLSRATENIKENSMELGAFSISLTVKDLAASRTFYESLGFTQLGGAPEQNYLILQNGTTVIGLFHGMFDNNILTFNPGWDHNGEAIDGFTDVRDIQRHLKNQGIAIVTEADESSDGPASLVITDPDGNMILVDQHVPRPD